MKKIITEVYEYDELSEQAQEKAREWYMDGYDYFWHDDNVKTLREFEKIFPIKVTNFSYGGYSREYFNYSFTADHDVEGFRLFKYLVNNYSNIIDNILDCPLTGYCMDYEILQPLKNFAKSPNNHTSLEDILVECVQAWLTACNQDYEYSLKDEQVSESIRINGYTFTVDGKKF